MLDNVDVNAVLDEVDVDRLIERIDVNRVLERVDVEALMARVDVERLVQRAGIPQIVAQTTGHLAGGTLDLLRGRLAEATDWPRPSWAGCWCADRPGRSGTTRGPA